LLAPAAPNILSLAPQTRNSNTPALMGVNA